MGRSGLSERQSLLSYMGMSVEGLAVAFYLFSTVFDFLAIIPGFSFARLTGILLIVLALLKSKDAVIPKSWGIAFAFFLLISGSIALLLAPIDSGTLNAFFSLAINILLLIIAASFRYTKNDVRACEFSMVAAGVIICVLMLVSPGNAGGQWETRVVVNIAGSQQDPNELCGYFIFPIAYCSYRGFKESKLPLLLVVAFCLYSTLLTGSRGGLIACLATVAIAACFGFFHSKHRLIYIIVVMSILMVVVVNINQIISLLPPTFADRFMNVDLSSGTASQRTTAWGDVWEAYLSSDWLQLLVGHGFGSTTRVTFNGLVAHNSFLEVLYTLGIVGLLLYCSVIGVAIRLSLRTNRMYIIIAILGFLVLITTLSSYSFKPMWAVWMLAFVASKIKTPALESKALCQ